MVGREFHILANLGNHREFTSKEYIFISMRSFEEVKAKPRNAQSGQYCIIVVSHDS